MAVPLSIFKSKGRLSDTKYFSPSFTNIETVSTVISDFVLKKIKSNSKEELLLLIDTYTFGRLLY